MVVLVVVLLAGVSSGVNPAAADSVDTMAESDKPVDLTELLKEEVETVGDLLVTQTTATVNLVEDILANGIVV